MKKMMICCLTLLLAGAATGKAQDKIEASVSADIVSHYIWRGQDLGGVSVQPGLGVSFKGLSLSAWGSAGLSNPMDVREFDLDKADDSATEDYTTFETKAIEHMVRLTLGLIEQYKEN